MPHLTLGYVEKAPAWTMVSHLFPDKVGGRPAWLALSHLPAPVDCPRCNQPMVFLLQIYSPLEEELKRTDCFHRMILVFMCKNGTCFETKEGVSAVPFRVFRSQLPRDNPYYSSDPPPKDIEKITKEGMIELFRGNQVPVPGTILNICPVCGCLGSKNCGQCKKAFYCSKAHQTIHWKQSHKTTCPEYDYIEEMFTANSFLLPEFHLYSVVFDENDPNNDVDRRVEEDSGDESDEEIADSSAISTGSSEHVVLLSVVGDLAEVTQCMPRRRVVGFGSHMGGELSRRPEIEPVGPRDTEDKAEFAALEEVSRKETKEERAFSHFKEVLKREPDQVVRFSRGGKPLWVSLNPVKPLPCSRCGGKRIFEFQITPHLLTYLKLDKVEETSPDFATVYIFTCENSCPLILSGSVGDSPYEAYAEEFVTFDRVP